MQVTKHASEGIHPGFGNPGQISPEGQNRGMSGPKKGLVSSKNVFKKKIFSICKLSIIVTALFNSAVNAPGAKTSTCYSSGVRWNRTR